MKHEKLEADQRVILTRKVDGRPATPDELNAAYRDVFPHNRAVAATNLMGLAVAGAYHTAEDIAQDYAEKTLLRLNHYDPKRSAKAFAEGVIRMLCRAHARKMRRTVQLPDEFDMALGQATYEERLAHTQVLMFVAHAVTRLTERQHQALEDFYWHELSAYESSLKRGVSERGIEAARGRGRQQVRAILVRAFAEFGIDDWAWKLFE